MGATENYHVWPSLSQPSKQMVHAQCLPEVTDQTASMVIDPIKLIIFSHLSWDKSCL